MTQTLLDKAIEFVSKAHEGQMDKSGKPYIMHPIAVGSILACIVPDDENLVAAGFLHDTLEDTNTTWGELVNEFNRDIADLVREVTKKKVKGIKTFPQLRTRRGIVLKFADRLHNLSRMADQPKKWQEKYIKESKFWKS